MALGDSFTEGVGDWEPRLPNGVRGWADRVAKQLSKADPQWQYVNLGIRSRRLEQIIEEQIPVALELKPEVITFYAGGNDILEFRKDMKIFLERYAQAVSDLVSTGAKVLLFTGFDIPVHPVLAPFKRRNWRFNDCVRELALMYPENVVLVDYWQWEVYRDKRMWDTDKLHMNRAGHRYMAIRILEILGSEHHLEFYPFGDIERVGFWQATQRDLEWLRQWVLPMFGRRMRGVTLGDSLPPRWPEPIYPAKGMKKQFRKRRAPSGAQHLRNSEVS